MADETVKKTAKKPAAKPKHDPYEMVTVRLHMDKQHMAPLHVVVNDFIDDIPRGVDYQVPYYVAKHLEEMEKQDTKTLLLTKALVEKFDRKARALGAM